MSPKNWHCVLIAVIFAVGCGANAPTKADPKSGSPKSASAKPPVSVEASPATEEPENAGAEPKVEATPMKSDAPPELTTIEIEPVPHTDAIKSSDTPKIFRSIGEVPIKARGAMESVKEVDDPNATVIPVYYGSNRVARIPPPDEDAYEDFYTSRRGPLHYGISHVSVPKNRKAGEMPTATETNRDTAMVFVLKRVAVYDGSEEWIADVAKATQKGERDRHDALVFIHGFNVSFADAIYRTAQLKVDLDFNGPALAFSWPSHASLGGYKDDEDSAQQSVVAFETFLRFVMAGSKADKIHVIAHSMGNRVMTAALANLANKPTVGGSPIDQVILAAPDVGVQIFHDQIVPHFLKVGRRRTLYANSKDLALRASVLVHKNAQRLGDSVDHVKGLAIEAVDAGMADTSLLAHSYYGDVPLVIDDIRGVLAGKAPQDRSLSRVYGNAWKFKLADPSQQRWLAAVAYLLLGGSVGWFVRGRFFSKQGSPS